MAVLDDVVCLNCTQHFQAKMKSTFLGFRKYRCTSCDHTNKYPLRPAYRFLYWFVLALFVFIGIGMLAEGKIPLPGILALAAVPSLIIDRMNSRSVRMAREASKPLSTPLLNSLYSKTNQGENEISEEESPTKWHWFLSTAWWTPATLLICPLMILLGIDGLSVYWSEDQTTELLTAPIGLLGLVFSVVGVIAFTSSLFRKLGYGKRCRTPTQLPHRRKIVWLSFLFCMIGISIPMYHAAWVEVRNVRLRLESENALTQPWVDHRFGRPLFAIRTPSNWKLIESDKSSPSALQLKEEHSGLILNTLSVPKLDTTAKTIEDLQDNAVKNFKLSGREVTNTTRFARSYHVDRPMREILIEWQHQTEKFCTVIRHIEFENHWVCVIFHLKPSQLEEKQSLLFEIANSIWRYSDGPPNFMKWQGVFNQRGFGSYPMTMYILKIDPDMRIEGVLNWPTLDNSTTRFRGSIDASLFSITEHEVLSGEVVVPVQYDGVFDGPTATGIAKYNHQSNSESKFELQLKTDNLFLLRLQ